MVTEADINRINVLARKSKTPEGLTEAEKAEQAALRRAYIDAMKASVKAALSNVDVIDESGNRVSLEEEIEKKRAKKNE